MSIWANKYFKKFSIHILCVDFHYLTINKTDFFSKCLNLIHFIFHIKCFIEIIQYLLFTVFTIYAKILEDIFDSIGRLYGCIIKKKKLFTDEIDWGTKLIQTKEIMFRQHFHSRQIWEKCTVQDEKLHIY